VAAGVPLTKDDVNRTVGTYLQALDRLMDDLAAVKGTLDTMSAAEMVTRFGFELDDATVIKSALTDFDAVRAVYETKTTFMQRLWGLRTR
jgi:uncharacterized protein